MHIRAPHAQIRDDGEFSVRLNAAGKAPFAVIDLSGDDTTALTISSPADCDRLIRAAILAKKALLLHETFGTADDGRWCSSKRGAWEPGGQWQCTLPGGHEGRHEARGTFPLPVWSDGDTHARYDETAGTGAS